MDELSEKDIIIKIKEGNIEYFSFFVKKYSPVVYLYIFRRVNNVDDTHDIIQNSFIKMYKVIHVFDPDRQFYPYFFTIIKNEIIELYRKRRIHLPLFEDAAVTDTVSQEEALEFKMLFEELHETHKGILTLYYIEGYSYKDIAKKLKKPLNTVKTLIRRAKIELRSKYAIDS